MARFHGDFDLRNEESGLAPSPASSLDPGQSERTATTFFSWPCTTLVTRYISPRGEQREITRRRSFCLLYETRFASDAFIISGEGVCTGRGTETGYRLILVFLRLKRERERGLIEIAETRLRISWNAKPILEARNERIISHGITKAVVLIFENR